jgi:hypothetical protein
MVIAARCENWRHFIQRGDAGKRYFQANNEEQRLYFERRISC